MKLKMITKCLVGYALIVASGSSGSILTAQARANSVSAPTARVQPTAEQLTVYVCVAECFMLQSGGSRVEFAGASEARSTQSMRSAFQDLSEDCKYPNLLTRRSLQSFLNVNETSNGSESSLSVFESFHFNTILGTVRTYTFTQPHLEARFTVEVATVKNSCKGYPANELPAVDQVWGNPIGG